MAFRLGHLGFISGLPIRQAFEQGWAQAPEGSSWRVGWPGELDAWMAAGELDAAPISSLEFNRRPGAYTPIAELAISSWGRLGSALFFSKQPFARLGDQAVALPKHGATSNALVVWLLAKTFGAQVRPEEVAAPLDALLESHSAALVIGDEAILEARKDRSLHCLDLGESWWRLMHTPLVHTIWAVRSELPEQDREAIAAAFAQAKAAAHDRMAEVSAEAGRLLGLSTPEAEAYFALLTYDFAPMHRAALDAMGQQLLAPA